MLTLICDKDQQEKNNTKPKAYKRCQKLHPSQNFNKAAWKNSQLVEPPVESNINMRI